MILRGKARVQIVLVLLAMVAAACSVDSPRHGRTALQSGGRSVVSGAAAEPGAIGSPASADSGVAPVPNQSTPGAQAQTQGEAATPGGPTPSNRPRGGAPVGNEPLRASATGISPSTITMSVSGVFSGPYGALVDSIITSGVGTWAGEVNAGGGIGGRKIVVKKVDSRGTADGAIAACKEEQSNGSFLVLVSSSPDRPEMDCLEQAGVPALNLFASSVSNQWNHVHALTLTPTNGAAAASFVLNVLKGGGKKIGVLATRDQLFAAAGDGFVKAAKSLGLNVVVRADVEVNHASFVPELSRMRDAGVQIVAMFVFIEVIGVLRDARVMGYTPKFTGGGFHIDEFSQAGRNLMDGVTAMRPFNTVDAPAYKDFAAKVRKYGQANSSSSAFAAYGAGLVLGRALELAGRNPTRPSFDQAFRLLGNYDNQIWPPLSWAAGPLGTRAWFPAICCHADYTWKSLGPARESF